VVTCHIVAKECSLKEYESYQYYTRYTAWLARDINKNFYNLHDWLKGWENIDSQVKFNEKLGEL